MGEKSNIAPSNRSKNAEQPQKKMMNGWFIGIVIVSILLIVMIALFSVAASGAFNEEIITAIEEVTTANEEATLSEEVSET